MTVTATDTTERILEAATDCMRLGGLRHVSMNEVALHAGVSRMSVYRHFVDREALVQAALERLSEQTTAAAAPFIRRRRTLASQVAEAATWVAAQGGRDITSDIATLQLAQAARVLDRWIDFWVPFLEAARERGEVRGDLDARQAGEWIMRMIISLVTIPSVTVDLHDRDQVRRYVTDHIVNGFQ
jgi:AcrR family transcriptional regulator